MSYSIDDPNRRLALQNFIHFLCDVFCYARQSSQWRDTRTLPEPVRLELLRRLDVFCRAVSFVLGQEKIIVNQWMKKREKKIRDGTEIEWELPWLGGRMLSHQIEQYNLTWSRSNWLLSHHIDWNCKLTTDSWQFQIPCYPGTKYRPSPQYFPHWSLRCVPNDITLTTTN